MPRSAVGKREQTGNSRSNPLLDTRCPYPGSPRVPSGPRSDEVADPPEPNALRNVASELRGGHRGTLIHRQTRSRLNAVPLEITMILAACGEKLQLTGMLSLLAANDAASHVSRWTSWLEPTGTVLAATVLVILCFLAWGSNLIALPGNWIAVALLAAYAWLGPQESRANIGSVPVVAACLCALLGEILEFAASAFGAQRAGASRRATLYAVLGSVVGAITGAVVGIPVPIIGPILAAILFAGLGATAGAMWSEWSDGRPWRESWKIGHAAFWGRTFGTLGKITAGLGILLIALGSVLV